MTDEINPETINGQLVTLGANFYDWFWGMDYTGTPASLFSSPVSQSMTADAIISEKNPTAVQLKDMYALVPTLMRDSMFFIVDNTSTLRTVMVFAADVSPKIIALRTTEPGDWEANVDVYSASPV